jgi:hypothetical protein
LNFARFTRIKTFTGKGFRMQKLYGCALLIVQLTALTACSNNTNNNPAKTAVLKIGEAIQFSSGKITKLQAEGDMVFRYMPPQSPHGWRYNPTNGQIEYQAQVGTTGNYPLLSAAKTGAFKTNPDIGKITTGDINGWTEDEYDIGPGRFIIVRGYTDKRHWLVRILKLTAASNDPKTWQLSFNYEPITISTGAAGTAGTNIPLPGVLTFRERLLSEKIIRVNLANGAVTELADGYGVSQNQKGEYAYVNTAQQIVLADKSGKQTTTFNPPASATPENTIGGSGLMETVIAPAGNYIAVAGITRRMNYEGGGISLAGQPLTSVAVVDRTGKEIASFISATFPTWTKDGRLLMADPDKPGIFITDASLKNIRSVPNVPAGSIAGISISPDEKTIAFSLNYRIWLINIDGSGLRQLTQSGLNEVTPAWSPDGKYLAFQQSFKDKKEFYQVLVLRINDSKLQVVADQQGANREPWGRMSWVFE